MHIMSKFWKDKCLMNYISKERDMYIKYIDIKTKLCSRGSDIIFL